MRDRCRSQRRKHPARQPGAPQHAEQWPRRLERGPSESNPKESKKREIQKEDPSKSRALRASPEEEPERQGEDTAGEKSEDGHEEQS